ncbi:MAG: hypothetical protein NVSMB67_18180 [Flavisolibacter sp.]
MQKKFRILRNNKELGPLSLDELIGYSLNSKDLIWVDGQSSGWRYPREIADLKDHMIPLQIVPTLEKDKQTLPYHPASHVIRPQGANTVSTPVITHVHAAPGSEPLEEELTAEKIERKATEIYQRIQAFTQQSGEEVKGSQTKYARSLEDLKQEYANWLQQKNNKKNYFTKKNGFILAGSLICLSVLTFLIFGLKSSGETPAPTLALANPIIRHAVYQAPVKVAAKQQVLPINENKKASSRTLTTAADHSPNTVASNYTVSSKELTVDKFIDSIERILAARDHQSRLLHLATLKSLPKTTPKKVEAPLPVSEPKLEITKPDKNAIPLSQLVNMNAKYMYDANQQLFGLEVTIQNRSIQILKTVTVDVFYYKKGGKLFDKETLYFTNIQPGNSFTLSTPGNRKAASARFQIGQITSTLN